MSATDDARARTEAWLEGVYRDELGRELGAEGRKYWTDDVHERGQTREQVIANIRRSPEYDGYRRGLAQRPDPVTPVVPVDPDDPSGSSTIPEPKVGGYGGHFEDTWNPLGRRLGVDLTPAEQMGSIPFVTSNQYGNRYKSGRFVDFLHNKPQESSKLANSLIASMWDDTDSFLS
tara:strand:- start:20102 stop:20626 length:525 start_codon:yes stop_codon:yes gene_type:complete